MSDIKYRRGVVTSGQFQIIVRPGRFSFRNYEHFSSFYSAYHAFRHLCSYVNPYYVELLFVDHFGNTTSIVRRVCTDSYYSLIWYCGRTSLDWWFDYGG